jgi:hypothetical protein
MTEDELMPSAGPLHHVELWVPDLGRAAHSWGWLLTRHAGGPEHRAAHLEDADGFEVELVSR